MAVFFSCSWLSRVDALQLGDCGQEMALISRLTEGTKVFLSKEESQHFVKKSVSVVVQNTVVLANMPNIDPCLMWFLSVHQVLHSQLRGRARAAL